MTPEQVNNINIKQCKRIVDSAFELASQKYLLLPTGGEIRIKFHDTFKVFITFYLDEILDYLKSLGWSVKSEIRRIETISQSEFLYFILEANGRDGLTATEELQKQSLKIDIYEENKNENEK